MTEHPSACLKEAEIAVLGERSEQVQKKLEIIESKIDVLVDSMSSLKTKASIWGGIVGTIGAGIVTSIDWLKR